ncbi:hypothetical protein IRJ41_011668 [Triplophysa rosa]|uniref:Uncharacterized protein n=1 Tax=Triplophysa rosa TaxID=992332 RepID=A0A9W7TN00_TRIRA|nr:hypothetical protein IRJ41_011668 [Triplophysa rosa]
MSTQETELPDCQEKVGLKRKLTGPPRLLLGKSKSREKADSQRRLRRDKCCEDTPENIDKQQDSPQKASETEEMKTQHDAQGDTILVTLEESQGKEENDENKTGMIRSTSKSTIKRMFSSLLCSGGRRKESETQHNSNAQETKKSSPRNKAQTNMHENKLCDANYEAVAQEKGKRNFFFMVWPISKRSSSDVIQGRQCREQGSSMLLQETPPKDSFKKIYRIFRRRKKAHPPDNHNECGASKTTHIEVAGDQLNQLSTDNMEIPSTPKQDHLKKEQEIEKRASETFTFSAEVSVNTNIESGHIDNDQEDDQIVLSTTKEEKHTLLESTNEILQTGDLLNSCCFHSGLLGTSNASRDAQAINDAHQKESDKNYIKCRPVITIDRVYTPEEENQESHVNEASRFDFLSMNGSWQYLQINSLTNNTLHPSDMSSSPELDPGRCNETLLIQTAISMVQTAIRGAVELLANEQQQNQISLDSV